MSEQTPTSTDDLSGVEPSMEDILASIRKIISEDEPVALESPEDVTPVELVSAESAASVGAGLSSFGQNTPDIGSVLNDAEGDSVDLNIDDVLAGLADEETVSEDLAIPDVPVDATEDFSVESLMEELNAPNTSAAVDVDKASDAVFKNDDDVLDFLDTETNSDAIGSVAEIEDTQELTPDISELVGSVDADDIETPLESESESIVADDDVEMDALLDDILLSPDDAVDEIIEDVSEEAVADTVENLDVDDVLDDILEEPEELSSDAEQSDLELVKSLMAELADDPGTDELALETDIELETDLDTLIDVEDAVDVSLDEVTLSEDLETDDIASDLMDDAENDDILDDILDMTLEDELQNQPDDLDLGDLASLDEVAAAEQENILENILEDVESDDAEIAVEEATTELPSLAEIAAAAEADAVAVETSGLAAGLGGAAAGAGLAALAAKVADTPEADIDTSVVETSPDIEIPETEITETSTETQSLPTQETSMPVKAVKTDTIIDEVTETAAVGAFAELNQVVEDKAVFNERGPRIGDLVQEALRPMLKEWLDANLKGIVERAVTKEVKRISKGQ